MTDIYAGHDPRDLPAYTLAEASHYLHVPVSTLRTWVLGRDYDVATGKRHFKPVIELADPDARLLSFHNLVEGHVLRGARRDHNVPLKHIRPAVDYVRKKLGVSRPLATVEFATDGVDLFVEQLGRIENASRDGQLAIGVAIRKHLERIDRSADGLPARLFLFTRARGLDQPRAVVADPRIEFGRPVLAGTGAPTAIVLERYLAGESSAQLAEDYGCAVALIEEAIRCEWRDVA